MPGYGRAIPVMDPKWPSYGRAIPVEDPKCQSMPGCERTIPLVLLAVIAHQERCSVAQACSGFRDEILKGILRSGCVECSFVQGML